MQTGYFFVYGTLRRGFANFRRLASDALSIEPAETTGLLYHLPQGYPAMLDAAEGKVLGEVMTFPQPEATLDKFDKLEGYKPGSQHSHYLRIIKQARIIPTGRRVRAWGYIYPPERLAWGKRGGIHIPHGDWARFVMESTTREGRRYGKTG
jgi:gamma-glutamylcyclotransferase (GGCT)/AIG2-like uncharacterized protein YtfP